MKAAEPELADNAENDQRQDNRDTNLGGGTQRLLPPE